MSRRQFLHRLFFFLVLFVLLDVAIGEIFSAFISKVQSGTLHSSYYGFEESSEQILIFGASEVAHSFNSNYIEDSLNMTCYNLGIDGYNIYYHYALLHEILKRHTPDCIIFSSGIGDEADGAITGLFPYYSDHSDIKNLILDTNSNLRFKLLINSYKYNSMIIKIVQGLIVKKTDLNGYKPLFSTNDFLKLDTISSFSGYSEKPLNYYQKMLEEACMSGANVFVVNVPTYQYYINFDKHETLTNLTASEDVVFISFMNDSIFLNNPKYFVDRGHLNDNGASIFSKMIVDSLKLSLKPKMPNSYD